MPGDSPSFRRTKFTPYETPWPESIPFEIIAKCQHHGLPTRFLDFSHHGLAAAHFAISDAIDEIDSLKKPAPKDKDLAVWAFCLSSYWEASDSAERRLQVVSAPSSDNDFLFKQKGIFLFDCELNSEWQGSPKDRVELVNLLTAFRELDRLFVNRGVRNVFKTKKILLNKKHARKVNELLYREGFTHAYFRPSYQWVLKTIEHEHNMNLYRN